MEVIFNGISSNNYSLKVKKHPPLTQAEVNNEKQEIPGRDGYLTISDGTRKGISIPVEFLFYGVDEVQNARQIKQWLTGEGQLIFSDEPDKYYKANIFSPFDINSAIKNFGEFEVIFDCQPFAYSVDNNIVTLTSPTTINNPGTVESEPILKIYGAGNVSVTLNGNAFSISNMVDYITVDSVAQSCYKDTAPCNNQMEGEFPHLDIGQNNISWTGTITKMEIIPNWRWL